MADSRKSQTTIDDTETRIDFQEEPSTNHDQKKCQFHNNLAVKLVILVCIPFISFFAAVVALPLLLLALIATRIIQFLRHDNEHGYFKAFKVKLIIRNALCIDVLIILLGIGVLLLVNYISGDKFLDKHPLEIRDDKWLRIFSILIGFYLLSFVLLKSVHAVLSTTRVYAVIEGVSEIIDCLIVLWAQDELQGLFKTDEDGFTILGYPHDEVIKYFTAIEVILFYLIGYNLITLFTQFLVFAITAISRQKNQRFQEIFDKLNNRFLVYYANGLKWSIDFVLSILMLLITWVFYIDQDIFETIEYSKTPAPAPAPTPVPVTIHLGVQAPAPGPSPTVLKDLIKGKGIWSFVAWSLVSLLICTLFWLIKSVLLLAWKAHTVYERLRDRILDNGKELYYLCAFGHKFDIFKKYNQDLEVEKEMGRILKSGENQGNKRTVDDVKRIAQYFVQGRTHLHKEKFVHDILHNLSQGKVEELIKTEFKSKKGDEKQRGTLASYIGWCVNGVCYFICFSDNKHPRRSTQDNKKSSDDKVDAQTQPASNEEIEFVRQLFRDEQQVVRAHSRCMILANTLSSAKEVASCLNNIIIGLILVSTFIIWLLLTKMATKEVIVFFASSLLAGTFIFGNTCKTLFQSILFVFVVHPFDVGDLCVIDDTLLEVKSIEIWKTIFSKVGWQKEVIYPNAQLSNKKLINHRTDIDWNDRVEMEVSSLDKQKIIQLVEEIEKYLENNEGKFTAGYNCVEIMEIPMGVNIKIVIDFKHNNNNLKNSTYFESVKKKRKLRSEFILYVQDLVNQKQIRGSVGDSVDPSSSKIGPLQSTEEKADEEGDGGDEEESKTEEEGDQKASKNKEGAQETAKSSKEDCDCSCVEKSVETENDNSKNEDKKDDQGGLEITEESKQIRDISYQ